MHLFPKVLILIVCFLCMGKANGQYAFYVEHYVPDSANQFNNYTIAFTAVESASLRESPDIHARLVTSLPIGSSLKLLAKSSQTYQMGGMESHWYWAQHGSLRAWVWGGLITTRTEGSQRDPSVKFLLNYTSMDSSLVGELFVKVLVADLRAVRDGKQLDRKKIKIAEPMMGDFVNMGTRGLKGIDDLLRFSISGESCGTFSGEVFVGWAENQFTDEWVIGGVADAEFYEGEIPIFPTALEGLQDTVLVKGSNYEIWFEWQGVTDDQGNDITEVVAWIETTRKVVFSQSHWLNVPSSLFRKITAFTVYTSLGSCTYLPEDLPQEIQRQLAIDRKSQK